MKDLILPQDPTDTIYRLIRKYRADLVEAVTATTAAVQQLKQQLANMERNQVAMLSQKALLDTLEKDLATAGFSDNSSQQANDTTPQSP